MKNIVSILRGPLCPWNETNNLDDDYYAPELRTNKQLKETYAPHYQIKFSVPAFSAKIKYYQRLIDNDRCKYTSNFYNKYIGAGENIIAYQLKKFKGKIIGLAKDTNSIILNNNYELSLLTSKQAEFNTDRQHKETTVILHYLLTALVKCYMEIQFLFAEHINEDDKLSIEDFYTNKLNKQAPENTFIVEIKTIELSTTGKAEETLQTKSNTPDILSFTYSHLTTEAQNINDLFQKLRETNRIDNNTNIIDFKHLFSGKEVEAPIKWTGAKSDLAYLMKLLVNTHKVLIFTPKNTIWDIVCHCFVDADGRSFDKKQLRGQQKPKRTKDEIEKMAKLLP